MDKRLPLDKHIRVKDFQEFYWLKTELLAFCKTERIPTTGSKIELTNRITQFLQTGKIEKTSTTKRKSISTFDWNATPLSPNTIITDNYKNTTNVRQFFETQIGGSFKFNVRFMNWMKSNVGKTLSDAIEEWHQIKTVQKKTKKTKEIAPQFEYNRYLRDFLADNPGAGREMGMQLWKIKKSMRGDNVYKRDDLKLLG